jgi:endonuclease/exonuclease/phosphatase family metal-dependent hydrolase
MDERAGTGALRVATLNIWGRRGAWQERRRVLAEGFRELEPDLVAFQEAIVGNGYDQVIDILGAGYHLAHQADRELGRGGDIEDGQGISMASRWPLGRCGSPT